MFGGGCGWEAVVRDLGRVEEEKGCKLMF